MASYPERRATETSQAYDAACEYFSMGVARSLRDVARKLHKSSTIMGRWSRQHDWVERAKEYDAAVRADEAQERTRRYLADLEDHRTRYQQAGKALYGTSGKLLQQLNRAIEAGEMEMTPAALGVLVRAFTASGDMEAHALSLDELLPRLAGDDHDHG